MTTKKVVTENIKVQISGLIFSPIGLSLNDESTIFVNKDGIYTFPDAVKKNFEYEVKITNSPIDRRCIIQDPIGVSGTDNLVHVRCTQKTNYFIGGQILGHHNGNLQVMAGTETVEIPGGSTSYLFDQTISGGTTAVLIPPAGEECFFNYNNSLTYSITNLELAAGLNIYCRPAPGSTYTPILTFSGLSGTVRVSGRSLNGVTLDASYSASGNFLTSYGDTRNIMEITSVPSAQRCYFNDTGTSLYSEKIPAADHPVHITCTARSLCEYSGLELPSVDGEIRDVSCVADKLAYAGKFNRTGRQYGLNHIQIDAGGNGGNTLTNSFFDRVHGKVNSIISDGGSGFYVAGSFHKVGDKKKLNLVRLDKYLVLDEAFNWETNGEVLHLEMNNQQLYLFGRFTNVSNGTTTVSRKGFAKINLSSASPKLSPLALPVSLALNPTGDISAQIIDSYLYMHGEFILNGSPQKIFVRMNKNSGNVAYKITNAVAGNTLFWKDLIAGKVWMINSDLGIVDPLTLSLHPQEQASNVTVPKGRYYTLTPTNNKLYMSNGSDVKVIDLDDMYSSVVGPTPQNFGKDSGFIAGSIENASTGFALGNDLICFKILNPASRISINSDKHPGMGCFSVVNENLTPANLGSNSLVNGVYAFYSSNTYNVILGIQHFMPQESPAVSLINMVSGRPITWSSGRSGLDYINSIGNDGAYFYLGGKFNNSPGCLSCKNLARIDSAGITDATWVFTVPLDDEVKKISVNGNSIFVSSFDSSRKFFGLDITEPLDLLRNATDVTFPPSEMVNISEAVATVENGALKFRERETMGIPLPPLNIYNYQSTLAATTSGRFVTAESSPLFFFRDTDGSPDYDVPFISYAAEKLRLTNVYDNICFYDQEMNLRCFDNNGNSKLNQTIMKSNYSSIKGVGNFLFLAREFSAPVVYVPEP